SGAAARRAQRRTSRRTRTERGRHQAVGSRRSDRRLAGSSDGSRVMVEQAYPPRGGGFEPAPFDVVEASRRVWLSHWSAEAASGMAVFTAILRSQQLLADEVSRVLRRHDLTFARYEVLTWLATDPESSVTLSWISKTLRIPAATVTNIIDKLSSDRLI